MSTGALPVGTTIQVNQNGLVLLGVYTASGGASIDCATRNVSGQSGAIFQADYDDYILEIVSAVPATNAVDFYMRMSTNGGASYDAGANYATGNWVYTSGGSTLAGSNSGANQIALRTAGDVSNSATQGGVCGSIRLYNPLSTSAHKRTVGHLSYWTNISSIVGVQQNGMYQSVTAVNACQFLTSSGNITGTIVVYGVAKSTTPSAVISQIGRVVNEAFFATGAMATGTTIVPWDNTVPQNTEGDQYMQLVYTPASAANRLKIDAIGYFNNSSGVVQIMSLFQDAIANALASQAQYNAVANGMVQVSLTHHMTAGTISPITFKIRCGGHVGGTTTFNGQAGAQYLGGAFVSGITITEFLI